MARYIDTKHLGKCETCRRCRSGACNTFCDCGEEYSPDLSKIPTADVVKVVRCKDCEHYDKGGCKHFGYHTYTPDVDEDDFCSYGERKE